MGKTLISSSEQSTVAIRDNNPPPAGCMWGMFHILDYHHWHVKKVFPHKKNRRHARYKRKTILYNQGEDQQFGVAEAESLLVRQHNTTSKSSPKNHKKEPRTMEKDSKTTETTLDKKHNETNKLNRNISENLKKHSDVFEAFREEKDLLLKFLRDLDFTGKKLHKASQNKAILTKSGSFPLAESSKMRNFSSSSLKHKQSEIWAFPKGEKLLAGTQAPKISTSSFVQDVSYEKPVKKSSVSSRSSSHGLNQKGWNQLVLHQFKVIKQKIKHALVEFRKSGYQRASSPEYSIINNEKETSQSSDDGAIQEYKNNQSSNETKVSDFDASKREIRLMRRTSSLNESLDRYTQLFEKSFSKDVKWQNSKSKSLKLMNEDLIYKSGNIPKFSRSNFSLPNIESIGFILHESLLDTNDVGNNMETDNHVQRKSVSIPFKSLDQIEETEIAETLEESGRDVSSSLLSEKILEKIDEGVSCDQREDTQEPEVGDGSFLLEKEASVSACHSKEEMTSLETSSAENITSLAEGREMNTKGSTLDKSETDLPHTGSAHSLPDSSSKISANATSKDINRSPDNHFLLFKSDTQNNPNFQFVKDILEFSGIMKNENIQMQLTLDHPLKSSLFKDFDASGEDIINPYDHKLLFNLINEVLLEIHEISPSNFPRPFSFNYCLHSMPKGEYLLKEVWDSVDSYLRLRPELDQTLDDVVGRDLAKGRGWMNLQQEEEHVALELEEMIMDDLLDELVFS